MTRSQIEYILALDKTRNFGRAAEACFITQSTLSAMVAKFEEQSGVVIFNRKTRPISVTPQGEMVLRSLRNISREYHLLDEVVHNIKGYEGGQLNLACIPTVAHYLYPMILDQLSSTHSELELTVSELTTERIIEEILAGNIDVGIVSVPVEEKELVEHDLYMEDFLLYDCGGDKNRREFRVTDIDLDRLWLLEEGHCLRNQVGKICDLRQRKKINGNLTYSCGSIYTLIEMVKRNQGVTLLPRLSVVNNDLIQLENIHVLQAPIPSRKIGLITHNNYSNRKIIGILKGVIDSSVGEYAVDLGSVEVISPLT